MSNNQRWHAGHWQTNLRSVGIEAVSGGSDGSNGVSGDVAELARRVIDGEFGNGDARRAALGSRYDEVQAEVNRILSGSSSGGSSGSGGSGSGWVPTTRRCRGA